MRDVIEQFPTSSEINEAYYYIGLGHFKLGHFSRAIEALEKVGTALSSKDSLIEKVEAGKRFYVKVDDQDFAILEPGSQIKVRCLTTGGDEETVTCDPVGRNARIVMGRIPTQLNQASPNNGTLEVRGGDRITVTYIDAQTAQKDTNAKRLKEVIVVGNGVARITDGSYLHLSLIHISEPTRPY